MEGVKYDSSFKETNCNADDDFAPHSWIDKLKQLISASRNFLRECQFEHCSCGEYQQRQRKEPILTIHFSIVETLEILGKLATTIGQNLIKYSFLQRNGENQFYTMTKIEGEIKIKIKDILYQKDLKDRVYRIYMKEF